MREIKFRGKCSQSKRWVYGAFVPDATERTHGDMVTWGFIRRHNIESGRMESIEVDRKSVGQYTGLKDKGGTESYHKDIVRTNAEQVGVVEFGSYSPTGNEWDNTWGWFIQFPNGGQISMDEHFRCWGEVVGNIYDNPELLEGDE